MSQPIHTTVKHKIGKATYYIVSAQSEKATETLDKKIIKLIQKDIQEAFSKTDF